MGPCLTVKVLFNIREKKKRLCWECESKIQSTSYVSLRSFEKGSFELFLLFLINQQYLVHEFQANFGWHVIVNQGQLWAGKNFGILLTHNVISLREKCPNTGVFLVRIFLYSVGIQSKKYRKNSAFGHFSRSV